MCKLLAIFAAIFRKKAPLPARAEKGATPSYYNYQLFGWENVAGRKNVRRQPIGFRIVTRSKE